MRKKSICYTKATETDEPVLRQILKENPMQGTISLSFEREPYFFTASQVEGNHHVTILSRNDEHKIVAMGSRSSRPYWINGRIEQVGYLSQLRLINEHRASPHRLMPGFEKMHEIHKNLSDVSFYLVTVLEDNVKAQRFLTSGSKKLPIHKEWAHLNTFVLPPAYKKVESHEFQIRQATTQDKKAIIELLQRNYSQKSIAPYWNEENLFSKETGLVPDDFFLALDQKQNPVACLAVWDQRHFKQIYVRDYDRKFKLVRPLLNWIRRWTKFPYFPKVGSSLSQAFLSHWACDINAKNSIIPLIQTAINENLDNGFHYFSLGALRTSPVSELIIRHYKPYTLRSIVYLAYWPEDENKLPVISNINAHLEIAVF